MPALDRLMLSELPPGARVLDLCCGVGHLARELSNRGFSVTGVDSSPGMIEFARRNAPEAVFISESADRFSLPAQVSAVVCTFDSLNHMHSPEVALASFRRVREALRPGGAFVFDFNSPAAYGERWDASYTMVEPDHAFFLRGRFDEEAQLGHTDITMFREMDGAWKRSDANFSQRPWTVSDLGDLLSEAGFLSLEYWNAAEALKMPGHYAIGRVYMRAR